MDQERQQVSGIKVEVGMTKTSKEGSLFVVSTVLNIAYPLQFGFSFMIKRWYQYFNPKSLISRRRPGCLVGDSKNDVFVKQLHA